MKGKPEPRPFIPEEILETEEINDFNQMMAEKEKKDEEENVDDEDDYG